jgi:MFS family permease
MAGLWVVSMGNYKHKGRWLAWSGFAWPASLLLLAMSTWYAVSLRLVVVAGLAQAMVWIVIATLILSNTAQPMRGRVMGLRTGVVISLPLGNFLGGAIAEHFGAPLAQGIYAVSAMLAMLVTLSLAPDLRKLD